MTPHPPRKRYVAFPGGIISELPADSPALAELRRLDKRYQYALDVTPKASSLAVCVAIGRAAWWPHAFTSIRSFPCQACANGVAAWVVCEECGGTRKILTIAWQNTPLRAARGLRVG